MSTISHAGEIRPLTAGKTIFDYADELAVEVPTSCKRTGRCHECVVEVTQGMAALCPRSEAEDFLRGDFRLACHLVDWAFMASPDDPEVRRIGAEVYAARAEAESSRRRAIFRRFH